MVKEICKYSGKKCFTKREAGEQISYFKNTRFSWKNRGKTIPQRYYFCDVCGYYHLTHLKTNKHHK